MRRTILPILAALALSATAWLTLRADTRHIDINVTSSSGDLNMQNAGGVVSFKPASPGDHWSLLDDTGRPALPVRVVNVMLPPGRRVDGVETSSAHSAVLATNVTVRNAAAPKPDPEAGRPVASTTAPLLAPAEASGQFPAQLARYLGTGTWHGYRIASFAVFPVRVEGAQVVFHDDIELHIAMSAVPDAPAARAERATARTVDA
ncbi:MAG TPA: hypothetical protein VN852_11025, partial [Candidatus Krumholzibacteria bacterium]|nr:hypothetical protein [Candidatus Krumholzibacteria bacterium]